MCYVKLSRNRPDFEKLSRDRGQQPRTLYSSLYSFYLKYIATYAPTFLGYNNSVLARVLLLRAVLPVHVFLTPFSCLMVKSIALSYGIPKSIREINLLQCGKKIGGVQIVHSTQHGVALTKNFRDWLRTEMQIQSTTNNLNIPIFFPQCWFAALQ